MNLEQSNPPDPRAERGLIWAAEISGTEFTHLLPVAGDASFRRYFRLSDDQGSWILMDAPPEIENSAPFVDIAGRLKAAGVHAPDILAADLDRGLLLLEDLGDNLVRNELSPDNPHIWFPPLFETLATMYRHTNSVDLPVYDRARLQEELNLFPDWYLRQHKGMAFNAGQQQTWSDLCDLLIDSALEQPQGFVHRDFHSCNLLYTADNDIGVIDFQDGVHGPLSYDFVSLLWDRYIPWSREQLEGWMEEFRVMVAADISPELWRRHCDLMGLQRNLKIVGIFARLHYRDGKPGYREMIPRFWGYVTDVLDRYPEFTPFRNQLEDLSCAP